MAEIVNLRLARKARARSQAASAAAANRIRFGRKAGQRHLDRSTKEKRERELDAHRLDPDRDSPRRS
jgi:hypothetical protein